MTSPIAASHLVDALSGSGRMLPAEAYTDQSVLDFERAHFFSGGWVCAGRVDGLAQPGSRTALQIGDDAVLIVRGDDNELRAFFNVCRHRGSELMPCGETARRAAIHCPYHGWTYSLDGKLRETPRYDAPEGFDCADYSLVPVRAECWHGWLMVNASGDAGPLSEWIGDFEQVVAPYEPERLVTGARHEYTMTANWKLPVENYHECFHCTVIHPQLCRVSPPESGDNYREKGVWVGGTMDLADGAVTMSMTGESDGIPLRGLDAEQLRRIIYVQMFPNLLVSLHPDYVLTHRLDPVTPGTTRVECEWLFPPEALDLPDFDPKYAVEFWDLTNRQDWAACEAVQRGVMSRGFKPGPLSADEDAVQHFVHLCAQGYLDGQVPVARASA
jgi:glycine betaine catabolism A